MNVAERIRLGAGAAHTVVCCLGRFQLQAASGRHFQVRTRKARAMLAALAISGRPMSRDALAALLWSDRGEMQARASLRQTIFELQRCGGAEPVLDAARDHVSIRPDLLVTDLELIREAAAEDDWQHLLSHLERGEAGLLSDLDGLDEEFDTWLRSERAHEPASTLAVAVEAAERCIGIAGPRAALDIVSEVLRLDPVNEAATRLAMRIDKLLGDNAALHRHYAALRGTLRDDFSAEPSTETVDLFAKLANGHGPAATPHPEFASESAPPVEKIAGEGTRRKGPWILSALVGAMVVLVLSAWLFLVRDGGREAPASDSVLVAVLPFEHPGAREPWLAEGLWDDTRAALSHNTDIRVLGRATTTATAGNLSPDQYRRRLGVAYLLEGTVRRSGNQVLVSTSLTRTSDGVAIWEDSFRARLGDPLALEDAIASGIEGKLRGRLAPGGGRRADQIATSPEVYALYSEARSLLRERNGGSARRARLLIRKALVLDPNYAPGWVVLAETMHFSDFGWDGTEQRREQALTYARRALALAPRLAQAHATFGFFLGEGSPAAERELELAVKLDPNHVEAWNWLGNTRARHFRIREAAAAYEQAVAIDPAWVPAALNLTEMYSEMGDRKAFEQILSKVRLAGGDDDLPLAMQIRNAVLRGDLSAAGSQVRRLKRGNGLGDWSRYQLVSALIALGYADEAGRLAGYPEVFGPVLRSERLPPMSIEGDAVTPQNFWVRERFGESSARAMVNLGHERDLLKLYRQAFASSDEAIEQMTNSGLLVGFAPTVAVALQRTGDREEAGRLLRAAARLVEPAAARQISRKAYWNLARVRAAQGRGDEALQLLSAAIAAGWLPSGEDDPLDIAQDPALHALLGDRRFQALRKRILDHIRAERTELGPIAV